ncbi:hypothetical protein T12_2044 [Trichinella patagoniensis]|uniref:Uncharacterized protein n=1 Tax=Trichinella patagoniensis TaxID=990121 RepID=A0A0V1A9W8_9BILA|nr:hypothetical protein T12_2044 [Trichinella patagoniensis]
MDNLLQIGLGRTADCIVASLSTATLAGGFFRAKRVIDNLTSEKISTLHASGDVFISELNCQEKKSSTLGWGMEFGMEMEILIAKISVMTFVDFLHSTSRQTGGGDGGDGLKISFDQAF